MIIALLLACTEVSVQNTIDPPEVTIIRPVSGGVFDPLAPVQVCARVEWTGDFENLDAVLVSDVDGTLATAFEGCAEGDLGATVTLSDSAHVLAFTVTDAANRTATDEVRIVPGDNAAPSCVVTSPTPGQVVSEGEPVGIRVVPADTDGDPLAIEVTSSEDGEVATGSWTSGVASFDPVLTTGEHTLLVTVADPRGATGTCSTTVRVAACLDADSDGFDTCSGDCNDANPAVNPDANEVANGTDDDCDGTTDEGTELFDDDGDGATELAGDCDDTDPDVNPGATEIPGDGIDQDCSGSDAAACFADGDDDGHGTTPLISDDADCTDAGESPFDDDCDDTNPGISPSANEIPGDGIDQDCDGTDLTGCFADADGDGYGSTTLIDAGDGDCDDPGESGNDDDCNDTLASVHPGAPELPDTLDNDCDGTVDEGTVAYDDDGDGYTENQGDCRDDLVEINPGASEIPDDGIDQDCSGTDAITCFADEDGDDYGHGLVVSDDLDCTDGGEAAVDGDCDDALASVNPGELEIPGDGIDQNCDGTDSAACFVDSDGDGFGSAVPLAAGDGDCDDPGESALATDCDDTDPDSFPGGTEIPDDGIDQDCSNADTVTCYQDVDGDTYAGDTPILEEGGCSIGDATSTDCDDNEATVYPGAPETAGDGVDQDCNDVDAITCFFDGDFDGFGSDVTVVALDGTCDVADNESSNDEDCDDGSGAVNPNGTEVVGDGIDQDCSGSDVIFCFADGDGDGFGDGTVVSPDGTCEDPGEADFGGDCDDANPARYPGATEIPDDGIDQDCSGADSVTCYVDGDDDGFGTGAFQVGEGGCGANLAELDGDCDDGNPAVKPGATDPLGDGTDTNCDGVDGVDADGDGFATGPDCDDSDETVFPGGPEQHDGVDNNCDGACDEGLIGYGDLVISELLIDPNSSGTEPQEFFELYNASGVEIRFCSGWTFSDQDSDSFVVGDPDVVVAPGAYVVFGKSPDLGGFTPDYVWNGMNLSNGGDELVVTFQGTMIDTLVWPGSFDTQGVSQELAVLDADANDDLDNWCDSAGSLLTNDTASPGAPNTCP